MSEVAVAPVEVKEEIVVPPLEQLVVRINVPEYENGVKPEEIKSVDQLNEWYEAKKQVNQQYYADDKMIMAWRAVSALLRFLQSVKEQGTSPEICETAGKLHEEYQSSEFAKDVNEKADTSRHLLNAFENSAGWHLCHDSDGIQVYDRLEQGSPFASFRVVGEVRAPLLKVSACLYEVDLFVNWFPMLKSAKELATVSRFRKIVQMEQSMLWPVWNRDVVANCFAVDMLEESKLLINVHSIDSFPEIEIPAPRSGVVRSEIRLGGFLITPISYDVSRVEMLMNVDPKLPYLPSSLINWFVKQVIHFIIGRLRTAANFDEKHEYARRMAARPEVYQYIKQMIEKHFPSPTNQDSGDIR